LKPYKGKKIPLPSGGIGILKEKKDSHQKVSLYWIEKLEESADTADMESEAFSDKPRSPNGQKDKGKPASAEAAEVPSNLKHKDNVFNIKGKNINSNITAEAADTTADPASSTFAEGNDLDWGSNAK
jgi:hypothetical protein